MGSKRSHGEEENILTHYGKKKAKKSSASDSESSSSSIDVKLKKKLLKKLKKIKKKEKSKKKKKEKKSKKDKEKKKIEKKTEQTEAENPSKSLAPMTKEEWEKQQNTFRRVYDEDTGRTRLIKGTGEIVEECVSKERQLKINKQATLKDGEYFQKILSMKIK